MTAQTQKGDSLKGVAPFGKFTTPALIRAGVALLVLLIIGAVAYDLHNTPERGATASYSLLTGAALGFVFERGRFCFFCILRDYIEFKNSGGLFSVLTALAVGGIGYAIAFGLFLPNAGSGRLPPDAHIGPVSWVLLAGGLTFGLGMALSGACISGHLYRLGEGYSRAPIALLGALIGFGIGFLTWFELYVGTISRAEIYWMPSELGYAGALILHLGVLALLGFILLRNAPTLQPLEGGKITLGRIHQSLFGQRWNPLATGALVGVIGVFAYMRVAPLGVTAQLGTISRTILNDQGYLGDNLVGLDTFRGCATVVAHTIGNNGFLIIGLIAASFSAALLSNRFKLSRLTPVNSLTALIGGVLMGWGSMVSLGCTVGTLLSGISAFALSGWLFGAAVFAGVFSGIKLKLHTLGGG